MTDDFDNEHDEFPPDRRQRFRRKLKTWYGESARKLPWRETRDPYRIWISEIMLQQTTVAAVVPYYERFFEAYPDLQSLADAEEHQVLRLWEGLGYYSRARNIWKAARRLALEREGEFPAAVSELQELPGIGRYTAGAIASFAFDAKAPILEANTLRLYSRLLGYAGDPRSAAGQRLLWKFAEDILPRASPGRFNQALMELGARVCTPKDPDCSACPVSRECRAHAEGTQALIPRPAERVPLTDVTEASIAVRRKESYLLRRRSEGERWAGLWDFPRFELSQEEVIHSSAPKQKTGRLLEQKLHQAARIRLQDQIKDLTGIESEIGELLAEIRHGVTRYRIHLLCFQGRFRKGAPQDEQRVRWVSVRDFADYPLSTTGRKFATLLARSHATEVR